jgi:1-deoxy-D-xylulose-5-phosphate reductoisomerase
MKSLAILGSTGSIGTSTLAAVEDFPDRFRIVALAAGHNVGLLMEQIVRHRPSLVSTAEAKDAERVAKEFPGTTVTWGSEGLEEVACHPDVELVVAGLVGAVGLLPTISAIREGKDIALANKETLVSAGSLVMGEVAAAGVSLLPVDSEHNAIHQALRAGTRETVRRLILTASGGPFRSWPAERIPGATVDDALAHPTWKMGAKISVDSATMMNKGLEIIEAYHLFGIPEDRIDVVIHPQSVVHSLVEFVDGSLIAQMSSNDMRIPILSALFWPDRMPTELPRLDLVNTAALTFEAPDSERFPAIEMAREALRIGGELPAVLNAANEEAVAAFLDGRCSFGEITSTVRWVVDRWQGRNRRLESFEQALAADEEGRRLAIQQIGNFYPAVSGSERRCC